MGSRWNLNRREEREDWLMSYADMLTLLLAFFVLLLSMSKIDVSRYETVGSGLAKELGKHESDQPLQTLHTKLGELLKGLKLNDTQISLGNDNRGLVLELDGATFFDPRSASLKADELPPLVKMAALLNSRRYSAFQVEVEGHTDDTPISTPQFPSNWELSAARASAVVRLFIAHGLNPTRLTAAGMADTRPKVPNHDAEGRPLPINQAINRRVTIHIIPR
ncbi:motility protein B [mine drainage metagenome]|uniref:Motility protein B n=1 Tax=mine drainage metagenome TaxID=410659 RepID=A0A1J5S297_9ZZZZ